MSVGCNTYLKVVEMNQLVTLTTQDVSRAYPVTDSLIIAEQFNKKHFTVMRDIRELEEQLKESIKKSDFGAYKIVLSSYITKQNKESEYYEVNEAFFMMLVMGYNTKKALVIKNEFIKQFISMKHELTMRQETRHIGVSVRKDITKMISGHTEGTEGNFKNFAISNYTRLIYKQVLGMNIKKWKDQNNFPTDCKARDFMTREQIEKVQILESKIADIIEFNTSEDPKVLYKKIQQFIKGK